MQYTERQQQAIGHLDGNLQVIACAGSGKTQVLAQRIVNILNTKAAEGITPANIVAFTFTEKAAGELKDRIHCLCREQLGRDVGLAEMFVGTIHGFCLDLLQTYEHRFLKYSVLSDVQQRLLIDRHSTESGLTDLCTHDGKTLKRWVDSKLYQKVLAMVREAQIDEVALGAQHPIRAALDKYHALLHRKRYVDYSMLLTEAVKSLVSNTGVRQLIGQRVKYLIVDEYQDVNPLQEALIKVLHDLGAQVCVVGDDDQTIYQWNGSDIGNILGFRDRYPGVVQIAMGDNFRSSIGVVDSARRVVEKNTKRLCKTMTSRGMQPYEQGDLLALRFQSPAEEAQWIAAKIKALRGVAFRENDAERGLSWSDCAILLRSVKSSAGPIIEALRQAGIPYVVKGMSRLFETSEVRAACAIFQYLNDEIDAAELQRRWTEADLGIAQAALESAIAWLNAEKANWPNRWRKADYSLQHTFLGFLAAIGLREETIPGSALLGYTRGEIVYYNLGKFSQVITDYEQIHYHSDAASLYQGFSGFLRHQAPDYYPEGWEGAGYATPDAVQIMTIHQAKGMEFPVVFVPALVKNTFPARGGGGRQWLHVIPREAVVNADRYQGGEEDERRLFYVALTRSRKYLFCTWAPTGKRGYDRESPFLREFVAAGYALTREPALPAPPRLDPRPSVERSEITLTFSELKYFFECPYQFKLRFLYGFNAPIHEEMGFGKSLHDALAEVHRRAIVGDILDAEAVPTLIDNHLHLPYAREVVRENLRREAERSLRRYFAENAALLDKIEHAEKAIELKLAEGVVVHGRIDLIRRTDTNQIIVIDFKSTNRAQEEDVSRDQLDIYALGYRQLAGRSADLVEIYNLDEGAGASVREMVDEKRLAATETKVVAAGRDIRDNRLCRVATCGGCDMQGICRSDIGQ
jgi:DNA helicase-2/ATP-dependent DNA helicase PcrA